MLQSLQSLHIGRQYQWLQEMQRNHAVWQNQETGEWHLFRYDDVKRALSDYTNFSSQRELDSEQPNLLTESSFLRMDPPEHNRYRNLVASVFTPRAISSRSERIKAIVQTQLDRVRQTGTMDAVADLAYPLPVTVIAEVLGLPAEDRRQFRDWATMLLPTPSNSGTDLPPAAREKLIQDLQSGSGTDLLLSKGEAHAQRTMSVVREMDDYFAQKLEARRRLPQEDLLTGLLQAEVDGEQLSQEEILGFCRLLLIAGHASTVGLLSTAILCLDEYPEIREQLRRQPELIPGAIEEVLRYAFILKPLRRETRAEVSIGDVRIPANSRVLAWLAAANHDPAQFPDPERFDITRSPNRHLSFGHGVHACIGAPLARLEASIALPMMLVQLPQMQRVPGSSLEIVDRGSFLWFKQLPVTFTPSL